jgi:hypothetical protein
VRFHERDADRILPSLWAGRGRRIAGTESEVEEGEPLTDAGPPVPPATATGTAPAVAVATPPATGSAPAIAVGMPGSNPFEPSA